MNKAAKSYRGAGFFVRQRELVRRRLWPVALTFLSCLLYHVVVTATVLSSVLELNPFYYVVYSIQLNTIGNHWDVNRLPNDILFFSQVAIIYLWMFSFYDRMKYNIYYLPTK